MNSSSKKLEVIEPLVKGLLEAVVSTFVSQPIAAGAIETADRLRKKSEPSIKKLKKVLSEEIAEYSWQNGIPEEAFRRGLEKANDAVRKFGPQFEELSELEFDPVQICEHIHTKNYLVVNELKTDHKAEAVYYKAIEHLYVSAVSHSDASIFDVSSKVANRVLHTKVAVTKNLTEQIHTSIEKQKDYALQRETEYSVALRDQIEKATILNLSILRNALMQSRDYYSTGVVQAVRKKIFYNWSNEVNERVESILEDAGYLSLPNNIQVSLGRILESSAYETKLDLVRQINFKKLRSFFKRQNEIKENIKKRAIGNVAWLTHQQIEPEFNHLVLLMGEWGSGRSRTMLELLEIYNEQKCAIVTIDLSGDTNIEDEILRSINRSWNADGRSLKDIHQILLDLEINGLVIALDDIDRSFLNNETIMGSFIRLIKSTTHLDRIKWVVAADSLRCNRYFSLEMSPFWKSYGVRASNEKIQQVNGWVSLDLSNLVHEPGFEILRANTRQIDIGIISRLASFKADYDSIGRMYCNPLPAWIHVENSGEKKSIFDSLDVYEKFWTARSEYFFHDIDDRRNCNNLMNVLCTRLFQGVRVYLDIDKLNLDDFAGIYSLKELQAYLMKLTDAKMLRSRQVMGTFEFCNLEVWAYLAAVSYMRSIATSQDKVNELTDSIAIWLMLQAADNDWFAESMSEFLVHFMFRDVDIRDYRGCLENWLIDNSHGNAAFYKSITSAPREAQKQFVDIFKKSSLSVSDSRELYLLLRMLYLMPTKLLSGLERISLAQKFFQEIGDGGLGEYYLLLVRRALMMLDLTDTNVLDKVLRSFMGLEKTGVMKEVVSLLIAEAKGSNEDDMHRWLNAVSTFLHDEFQPVSVIHRRQDSASVYQNSLELYRGRPEYDFFWQALLGESIAACTRDFELQSVEIFNRLFWMASVVNSGLPRHIAILLRSTINSNLGNLFYHGFVDSTAYSELFADLQSGRMYGASKKDQLERIYYIIFHTSPIGIGDNFDRDAGFLPWLIALENSKSLKQTNVSVLRKIIEGINVKSD